MDDALVLDKLRELLKWDSSGLDGRIAEGVGTLPDDLAQLARARIAIAEKLPAASERHRDTMTKIVGALDQRMRSTTSAPQVLQGVLEEVWSLEQQRQGIERRLEELKSAIAIALGPEQERIAGRIGVKTGGLAHSLRVGSPGLVPAEFMSRQPDRKAILMHFRQTGELVAGTSVTARRPSVRVWEAEGAA